MSEREIETNRRSVDRERQVSPRGFVVRAEGQPVQTVQGGVGYVYLVVDSSGSMDGHKLVQAKRGAIEFSRDARAKRYLTGLICFDDKARHLCDPTIDVSTFQREVQKIQTGGGTNMADAIGMAVDRLAKKVGPRIMVIVTDGMPNLPSVTLHAAQRAKRAGIDIMTIGTDDADERFLKQLASRTSLGVKVAQEHFGQGISSTAAKLPQLGSGPGRDR